MASRSPTAPRGPRLLVGLAAALAGCLPTAADSADGGADAGRADPYSTVVTKPPVDDCHVGIVGGRCDQHNGGCELGLVCEPSGIGLEHVCIDVCEDDGDCPFPSRCRADLADAGSPLRCMRPCAEASDCSCAGSQCAKDGYCR